MGDETVQNEDGIAQFGAFTQDKKMYYYEGSVLPIEWTNQHGCGPNSKVNCEIIIQYMCEDTADPQKNNFWPWSNGKWGPNTAGAGAKVGQQHFRSGSNIAAPRDGIPRDANDAATETIPDNEDVAIPDTKEDRRFGMHESFDHYDRCQHTERNKGLYTADQNMRRNDQRGTRQNPNGNRNGLECPEERDYYPWWHPSPWIDVAVLTNEGPTDTNGNKANPCVKVENGGQTCYDKNNQQVYSQRCAYYLRNSFNKHKKGYCDANHETQAVTDKTNNQAWQQRKWYNNRAACEEAGFTWYEVSLADNLNLDYPTCGFTAFSRVNHLGNAMDDENVDSNDYFADGGRTYLPSSNNANRFVWTIPEIPAKTAEGSDWFARDNSLVEPYQSCTLRIRYNISTSDFVQWPDEALEVAMRRDKMVDYQNNTKRNGDDSRTPLTQDPYVTVGVGDTTAMNEQFISLAANTNQYGRTFQDRSYKFAIRKRPTAASCANWNNDATCKLADKGKTPSIPESGKIFNVNVRGKRGNIVQTFPSVEYDFVPNRLALNKNDYVHFQWTGSDYNPRRGCNNGEGGPPDPNDFISSANANKNSRADRSNLIFMNTMAENLPMDMLGVGDGKVSSDFNAAKSAASAAIVANSPCGDGDANDCVNMVNRLAYLNQQSDGGGLTLRRGNACLTEAELDQIKNKNERENHPLNCAKLNAKPYPYFDAGVMQVNKAGKFAYFSSRNNNFSNRDQTGVVCVRKNDGSGCENDNGVLQDQNAMVSTSIIKTKSYCNDEASNYDMSNEFGAASCITIDESLLSAETLATTQADNDKIGDGNAEPCDPSPFESFFLNATVEQKIGLAIALLFVGMGSAWAGYYGYNRYEAQKNKGKKFAGNTKKWKQTKSTEMI